MNILTPSGYKNIMSCSIGDEVIAYDINDGHIIYNTIEAIEEWNSDNDSEFSSSFYLINDTYTMYKWQSVWANGNVTHANQLKIGDIIYDDENQDITITSITPTLPQTVWYRLEISGDHSYIADGITLHNASRFWVGGTGTWDASSTTNWSGTTGGAGGASVPTSADTVTIDAASGSGTITVNTNFTINSLTCGAMNMTLDFSANNNSPIMNTANFAGAGTRTVNMGNGTWTVTGTSVTANNFTNCTLNQGDSSIVFTNTSVSTLTLSLTSSPTYWNKFTFNRGASTGTIAVNMGTTGGGVETLIDIGTAAHTITFQQLRTTNVNNMIVRGTPGNLITIASNNIGVNTAGLTKSSLGIVALDYVAINSVTVGQNNMWYAGANSTSTNTTTGWIFTDPPARKLGAGGVG
jgi:hypothetical protein